jgi:hypothetical protein
MNVTRPDQVRLIEIEILLLDHFGVREILLQPFKEIFRFADNHQAHRLGEIFFGELGDRLACHGIDGRNVFVQRIEGKMVSGELRDFVHETFICLEIARVTSREHRLTRPQFGSRHWIGNHAF